MLSIILLFLKYTNFCSDEVHGPPLQSSRDDFHSLPSRHQHMQQQSVDAYKPPTVSPHHTRRGRGSSDQRTKNHPSEAVNIPQLMDHERYRHQFDEHERYQHQSDEYSVNRSESSHSGGSRQSVSPEDQAFDDDSGVNERVQQNIRKVNIT